MGTIYSLEEVAAQLSAKVDDVREYVNLLTRTGQILSVRLPTNRKLVGVREEDVKVLEETLRRVGKLTSK